MAQNIPSVFEEVAPDFLASKITYKTKLYRFDSLVSGHQDRFYFEFLRNGVKSYISTTSVIRATVPLGYGYYRWLMSMGDKAEQFRDERAVFGSAIHYESFKPLISRDTGYDFDFLKKKAPGTNWTNFQMLFPRGYREAATGWYYSFTRGLMSWFEFVRERVVEVWAVEIPLRSKKWGYAGTLDFIGLIRFNSTVVPAIIDMKSHVFSPYSDENKSKDSRESHEAQLEMSKLLWEENFGKPQVDGVEKDFKMFIFSPKAWRKKPTYDLHNLTDNRYSGMVRYGRKQIPGIHLLLLTSKMKDLPTPPSKTIDIVGSFDSIRNFNWEDHVLEVEI